MLTTAEIDVSNQPMNGDGPTEPATFAVGELVEAKIGRPDHRYGVVLALPANTGEEYRIGCECLIPTTWRADQLTTIAEPTTEQAIFHAERLAEMLAEASRLSEGRRGVNDSLDQLVTSLREELGEQRASSAAAESRHEAFKARVRAEAVRVAEEQGWCADGLNRTLTTLDLPPRITAYEALVTLTMRVRVDTDDEDTARQWIGEVVNADSRDSVVDILDWTRTLEIGDVEAMDD